MVNSQTFVRDTLYFIKTDLLANITDPISASRPSNSKFILTEYPQRIAVYPIITIKIPNYVANRAGMQVTNMDMQMTIEVRIWARNVKERDTLFTDVLNRLKDIQFTASGSTKAELHDFNMPSAVEINEEGDQGIKSKVMEIIYNFYNI